MNAGVIASRYAKALLRYVGEISDGDVLCSQVMTLEKALADVPQLRTVLGEPSSAGNGSKVDLLKATLGGEMHPSLESFILMVFRNGREKLFRSIFHDFVDLYFRSKGLLRAKLVSVVPSPKLEEALRSMVKQSTGHEVMIESSTDPGLIGGFTFTVDDLRFDASVSGQLETLRRQFIENNKRII